MKKLMLCAALSAVLGVASSALASKGPVQNAFQWPAGMEPTLDGDLSEWDVIPSDYFITTEQHIDIVQGQGGNYDLSDLAVKVAVSWSAGTNRLYYMIQRFDDYYDRNGGDGWAGGDDSWETVIDGDHTGDPVYVSETEVADEKERELAQGRYAQTAHYRFPPMEPFGWKWFWMSTSTWHDKAPWADYGYRLDGQMNSGEATLYIEVMSAAWDDFNFNGPALSVLHEFQEGQVFGSGWAFIDHDADTQGGPYDGYWAFPGDGDQWKTSATVAPWLCAPIDPRVDFTKLTAVEGNSWGRIKAAFIE